MPFRPCPSGCGRFLSADDGHDRCLQCLGRRHAEAAFVDDSCVCCGRMSMISLRSRLSFMKGLAPSAATHADLSGSSRGSPADALGDLRVTVRASLPGTSPRTSYSSRSEHPVWFPDDFAGPSHGAPSISFGAPSVDRMSIAASGDGFRSSEDEGAVGLPPSGVVAAPDLELTAMLARAAVSIGLEVNRPPSPELSRLDDWFLGAGHGSQPRSTPVPFFPEVHEELTKSWMAPFRPEDARPPPPSSLPSTAEWPGGTRAFPRWRERSRCTCAHETPPLGGTVRVSRPRPVSWQPLSRPKLTVLRARQPPPCTPWLSCRFTKPRRSNRCTRVVPTRGWCRMLYELRKSRRGPSGRRCHSRVPRWAWRRGTLRVGISQQCRLSLSPWTDLAFLRAGVPLEQVSRHTVVTTDASSTGWGATCNGQAASGLWTGPRLLWHINCLELWAVHLALRQFRPLLSGKHVLVRTDNTAAVSYINRLGGIRSHRMSQLARHLLLWSHTQFKSLRAVHIPGQLNRAADALSRQLTFPGEWRLHPETIRLIWSRFGEAQVDLFASPKSSHCQLYFSLTEGPLGTDALAHSWTRALHNYAYPLVSLLAQTLCKLREDEEQVLLVAPHWPNRTWFPELISLATAPPWRIPLRKDLLSQGLGTIWHPRPDLWNLHVWLLDGTRQTWVVYHRRW